MKVKLLMAIVALMAFAAGASAQDPGEVDTLKITFTHVPDMAADDSVVCIEVYFGIDEVVRNVSSGFGWDFAHLEMDSAVWTTAGANAYNMFKFDWSQNSVDSTNFHKRFQVTGMGLVGLLASSAVCHFWGHVNQWTTGDEINVTSNGSFVPLLFVDNTNAEFVPYWAGDATIAGVNSLGGGLLPIKFNLAQNYPNPFNPVTRINFDLPKRAHTTLTIFNVLGQRVATLVDEDLAPDYYEIEWSGTTDGGNQVASGIYFYRLNADEKVMTKKMMLLK